MSCKVNNHFIVRVCESVCAVCDIWTTSCVTFKITEPLNQPHERIKQKHKAACTGWIPAQSGTTHLPDAVSLSKKDSVIAETSFDLKSMSGKTGSSSNSVIQAQKLVDQLRVEAGMERIKVRTGVISQCMYLIVLPLLFIFSRIRNDTHTVCYINDFINVILFQRQKQKIYQHILHIKDKTEKTTHVAWAISFHSHI